jgi:hypothetical protein
MPAVLFDSHGFVRRMQSAGMPEPQAEALADEYVHLVEGALATKSDLSVLATKSDLAALAADLRETKLTFTADLRQTELRLEGRIEAVKSDILKWMFGTIGLQTVALLGAIVALAKALR